jgi:hypothetical protein
VIDAACAPWAHQIELLQTIPGVGPKVAQVIIAETGGEMSKFPSAAHLASWAGLAPAIYQSAGKRTAAGRRRRNKWLTAMLVEAAGSVGRMHGKNYLAVQHARMTRRRGMSRGPDRGRTHDPDHRLLHAQTRRAVQGPRPRVASQAQRGSPHPPACRAAREARPHRGDRSRSLRDNQLHRRTPSDGARAPWVKSFTGLCGAAVSVSGEPRAQRQLASEPSALGS